MNLLQERDYELIAEAKKAIRLNYDQEHCNHTVGAAIRCKNGKVYVGVNLYSLHGACAEQVAIGTAITNGERNFDAIVAVRGKEGEEIIPPCGNCRQILHDYMPDCDVIVSIDGELKKSRQKHFCLFLIRLNKSGFLISYNAKRGKRKQMLLGTKFF
jgi:hypothetical protein